MLSTRGHIVAWGGTQSRRTRQSMNQLLACGSRPSLDSTRSRTPDLRLHTHRSFPCSFPSSLVYDITLYRTGGVRGLVCCTLAQAHATYRTAQRQAYYAGAFETLSLHSPKVIGCALAASRSRSRSRSRRRSSSSRRSSSRRRSSSSSSSSERAHSRCCPQSASSVFTASSGSYGSPASCAAAESAACISLTCCVEHADGVTKLAS